MNKKLRGLGSYLYKRFDLIKMIMRKSPGDDLNESLIKDQILAQARTLCSDYIDDRLIRSGLNLKQRKITPSVSAYNKSSVDVDLFNKSMNTATKLEKLSSFEAFKELSEKRRSSSDCMLTTDDMSKVLLYIGEVLELRHTYVYTDVLQQLSIRSLSEINLRRLFMSVAKEIFSDGISWAKVVSLLAFAGALAADCVLSGSSIYVPRIKTWSVEYIENELMDWIFINGGWIGFFDHFTQKHTNKDSTPPLIWTVSALVLLLGLLLLGLFSFSWKSV